MQLFQEKLAKWIKVEEYVDVRPLTAGFYGYMHKTAEEHLRKYGLYL